MPQIPNSGPAPAPAPALEPEDYYYDGPYMVFTEAFHLRRGYCCPSGCRHCPYGFKGAEPPEPVPPGADGESPLG